MIIHIKGERWQTQILRRFLWHIKYPLTNWRSFNNGNTCPMWVVPLDGWITDPKEIIHALREEGLFEIESAQPAGKEE